MSCVANHTWCEWLWRVVVGTHTDTRTASPVHAAGAGAPATMLPTILVASLHAVAGSGGSVQVDPGGTIRIQSGGQLVVNQPSTTEMDVWAEFMAALDGAHECSLCDLVNDPCACPGIVCEGDPAAEGVFKEIVLDGSPGCTVRGWLPASLSKLTSLEALEVTSVLWFWTVPGCWGSVQDASGESKTALRCPSLAPSLNLPISFHVSFWTCPGCASR